MNDDADLDALLRRHLDTALPDDGFTARVVAALPPRPQTRPWALPAAAAIGTVLSGASIAPSPLWRLAAEAGLSGNAGTPLVVALGVALLSTLLACGWALAEAD